jgi:hypothetical protein
METWQRCWRCEALSKGVDPKCRLAPPCCRPMETTSRRVWDPLCHCHQCPFRQVDYEGVLTISESV